MCYKVFPSDTFEVLITFQVPNPDDFHEDAVPEGEERCIQYAVCRRQCAALP